MEEPDVVMLMGAEAWPEEPVGETDIDMLNPDDEAVEADLFMNEVWFT